MKITGRFIIILSMSILFTACATIPNDDDNLEGDHNVPMEEENRDGNQPSNENDSENIIDRDPDAENELPNLETDDDWLEDEENK